MKKLLMVGGLHSITILDFFSYFYSNNGTSGVFFFWISCKGVASNLILYFFLLIANL
ncbi:hypothetical protein HanPSC8_Chr03g0086141 [Helianthus annuus]|nr:hypothetical protein HanPSC8_Chr03g0086141 [Helianthus annuus]